MFNAIYQIIIQPLVILTEFFWELIYEITDNKGIAVIGLSFVVTFFTLPLYMVAEKWQETERQTQEKMKKGIERIKSTFKGDEQYMILNAYYKENHYHPIFALRSSFSLLIQIPFFMAAYNFLSNLEPLKDYSFLFIKSFGEPDATFMLGSFAINVLPISMTLINIIAGAIYSKGHPISEKIQIYVCALVFLLLLYDSPAGLVVYWTMNNILSLVKNIFYKIKNPRHVIFILLSVCLLGTPLLVKKLICVARAKGYTLEKKFANLTGKTRLSIFIFSSISLSLLSGLVIPTMLIESEVELYCFLDGYKSPFVFVFTTFCQALGFFVLWTSCFYALFSEKVKKVFAILFSCLLLVALINTFGFSGKYGPLTPDLIFMTPQTFSVPLAKIVLNAAILLFTIALIVVLLAKKAKIMQSVATIIFIALFTIGAKNSFSIYSRFAKMSEPEIKEEIDPIFHLSRNGKNVIVLMQDKLFLPYAIEYFAENPSAKIKFDGFTFYENTMSFGVYTMLGSPGIFGGYDYTPWEINQRTSQTIQQKHNEAILSLPLVFHENGFSTTVADMPYENYLEQPVEKMYENYPFINRLKTHGTYSDLWYKQHNMKKIPYMSTQIKRNFFYFSFFKMVSPILRKAVYHNEYWCSFSALDDTAKFIDNYSEIDYLSELTDFSSDKNAFLLLDNEATHELMFLQAPDYVPVDTVTDYGSGKYSHDAHYHITAGVLNNLPDFFEYLKVNDCYDNTKIIIVSDHGVGINTGLFDETEGVPISKEHTTATLIVKDFNQRGDMKFSHTFMTNADTPFLATKDLIKNARNPFTHNLFEEKDKASRMKIVSAPAESTRIRYNTGFKVENWYTVKDDIYKAENWSKYGEK